MGRPEIVYMNVAILAQAIGCHLRIQRLPAMALDAFPSAAEQKDLHDQLPLHMTVNNKASETTVQSVFNAFPGAAEQNDCNGDFPVPRPVPQAEIARPRRTAANLAEPGQTAPNLAKPGRTWLNRAEPGRTWPNSAEPGQTAPNLAELG